MSEPHTPTGTPTRTHNTTQSIVDAPTPATGTTVRVRFFAAARAAAGTEDETFQLPTADGAASTRREVEALLARRHPEPPPGQPPLAEVLARSSFLLDGVACPDPGAEIPSGSVLDVLPPFSGG